MDVSFSGLFSPRIDIVAPEFFLDTHGNVIERHVFPVQSWTLMQKTFKQKTRFDHSKTHFLLKQKIIHTVLQHMYRVVLEYKPCHVFATNLAPKDLFSCLLLAKFSYNLEA